MYDEENHVPFPILQFTYIINVPCPLLYMIPPAQYMCGDFMCITVPCSCKAMFSF